MVEIAKKLLELRISSKMNQEEIAKIAGVSQRTWSSYETGQTIPKKGVLWALAANGYVIDGLTTDIDAAEEAKGNAFDIRKMARGGTFPENIHEEAIARQASGFTLFRFSKHVPVPIPAIETDPYAMVMLPIYSQRTAEITEHQPAQLEEIESQVPVILETLGGSSPCDCGLVRVAGDSMIDMAIYDGDLVIFDRSRLEGDGVYVISIGGDVRVKRLEYRALEKRLAIRSENRKHYPEPEVITFEQASEMMAIHGKVISWMQRHLY